MWVHEELPMKGPYGEDKVQESLPGKVEARAGDRSSSTSLRKGECAKHGAEKTKAIHAPS